LQGNDPAGIIGTMSAAPVRRIEANLVISPLGMVEDVDAAACALLGYERDELLGLHGSELIPRDARPATAAAVDRMRRGELDSRRGSVVCKDGELVGVDVNGRPLPDGRLVLRLRRSETA
jgi:PAS domain S-box-containing protein